MDLLSQNLPFGEVRQDETPFRGPGRPRKDYTTMNTVFDTLEDFKNALQQAIATAKEGEVSGRVSCSMTFSSSALLPVDHSNQAAPCLLYTSPSPRDGLLSRMPSSA